jgi:hypothetical protein
MCRHFSFGERMPIFSAGLHINELSGFTSTVLAHTYANRKPPLTNLYPYPPEPYRRIYII